MDMKERKIVNTTVIPSKSHIVIAVFINAIN
jgi:hypothetical protein